MLKIFLKSTEKKIRGKLGEESPEKKKQEKSTRRNRGEKVGGKK